MTVAGVARFAAGAAGSVAEVAVSVSGAAAYVAMSWHVQTGLRLVYLGL